MGLMAGQARAADDGAAPDTVSVLPVTQDIDMLTVNGFNLAVQSGPQGLVVVDSGPASASAAVLAAIAKISSEKIRYIINTNTDPQMIGADAPLAAAGESLMQNPLGRPASSAVNGRVGRVALIVARNPVVARLVAQPSYPVWAIPTEIFERPQYNFYLNGQAISVVSAPAAHADGDTFVFFRRSDVVVAGELLDMTRFPVIDVAHGGSVQGELAALDRLINEFVVTPVPLVTDTDGTLVIPARGPLCNQADLVTYRDMVAVVRDRIADQMQHGRSLQQIQTADPTEGYDARFGATEGDWTTRDFVAAVYASLAAGKKKHGNNAD
jgi:glyoxylase-like metal-dependent hydrolase (beta-lactamase superfamily II)